jgi:hypothetical protein
MRLVPAEPTEEMVSGAMGRWQDRLRRKTAGGRLVLDAAHVPLVDNFAAMLAAAPNGGRVSRAGVERVAKGIARQSVRRHMLWANMPPPTAEHADAVANAEWHSFVDYAESAIRDLGLEIEPSSAIGDAAPDGGM